MYAKFVKGDSGWEFKGFEEDVQEAHEFVMYHDMSEFPALTINLDTQTVFTSLPKGRKNRL